MTVAKLSLCGIKTYDGEEKVAMLSPVATSFFSSSSHLFLRITVTEEAELSSPQDLSVYDWMKINMKCICQLLNFASATSLCHIQDAK